MNISNLLDSIEIIYNRKKHIAELTINKNNIIDNLISDWKKIENLNIFEQNRVKFSKENKFKQEFPKITIMSKLMELDEKKIQEYLDLNILFHDYFDNFRKTNKITIEEFIKIRYSKKDITVDNLKKSWVLYKERVKKLSDDEFKMLLTLDKESRDNKLLKDSEYFKKWIYTFEDNYKVDIENMSDTDKQSLFDIERNIGGFQGNDLSVKIFNKMYDTFEKIIKKL